MTSKVKGTEGIEFPDSTVQGSAAYSKAESNALLAQGPAFHASSTSTTVTAGTAIKPAWNAEQWDTGAAFDVSTGLFQPATAGYYQYNGLVSAGGTAVTQTIAEVRKNGTAWETGLGVTNTSGRVGNNTCNGTVFLNGTTDYIELFGSSSLQANLGICYFSAFLARKA